MRLQTCAVACLNRPCVGPEAEFEALLEKRVHTDYDKDFDDDFDDEDV